MQRPFILVAPNGARRSKADHPVLPVSLKDTVETAVTCHAAGADGLHLHIRDSQGAHSLDAGLYLEALAELRHAAPAMIVQITTEAAGVFDVPAQLACLARVRPSWASISVRVIAQSADLADRIYGTCVANGTRVQHILYDTHDYAQLQRWQAEGTVRSDQTDMLFVLGRYLSGRSSQPADLATFLDVHSGPANWMLCAFGTGEHACLTHAAQHGGDLRVGFENSLHRQDGTPWPDCAASVAALVSELTPHPEPIGG